MGNVKLRTLSKTIQVMTETADPLKQLRQALQVLPSTNVDVSTQFNNASTGKLYS
jgi:hypothetical protein